MGVKQRQSVYSGALRREKLINGELLRELPSSDEHAQKIVDKLNTIITNHESVDAKKTSENIAICRQVINEHLDRLKATAEEKANIASAIDSILDLNPNDDDYEMQLANKKNAFEVKLLGVLVRRNPGLYSRKYREALTWTAVAQKQTVAQLQH